MAIRLLPVVLAAFAGGALLRLAAQWDAGFLRMFGFWSLAGAGLLGAAVLARAQAERGEQEVAAALQELKGATGIRVVRIVSRRAAGRSRRPPVGFRVLRPDGRPVAVLLLDTTPEYLGAGRATRRLLRGAARLDALRREGEAAVLVGIRRRVREGERAALGARGIALVNPEELPRLLAEAAGRGDPGRGGPGAA